MAKRRKKKTSSKKRAGCPARYKGKKVRSRRTKRGTVCYVVKKTGQWRFVPKAKRKSAKKKRKSSRRRKR